MIEIIATTYHDAIEIQAGGADRIELVQALSEGGLTPSYGLIQAVIKGVNIPVNVMIRPHSDSFVYTQEEIELMKKDIQIAKELGANGVVFGVLTPDNEINENHLKELLAVCDGLDVTFHRAIDETDVVESINLLSAYEQITTVLTSGGIKTKIEDNINTLNLMAQQSAHINILVGGGLNFDNISEILANVQTQHAHFGTAVRKASGVDRELVKQLLLQRKEILSCGE